MAYNEHLANRVREAFMDQPLVDEVQMFKGLCFMVNEKMSICIRDNGLLCRIGQDQATIELETGDCRQMIHGTRVMKDFVWVDSDDLTTAQKFNHWITLALSFNKIAKASGKRRKGKG
ncbi:TfoX/Sxy family protein [Mucilaginibacter flavus]|uniref:TfoX/Sxy family protein n=1 Tax=Mucilaginibacter flavus TaxID=931504 RepID=UPI0025B28B76|nr:TfoX/Sxy family protein [Mucilaginibacter flavus]MDN3582121.1 TfoX/Sxy family protein [Mucilaginibacter flavus]